MQLCDFIKRSSEADTPIEEEQILCGSEMFFSKILTPLLKSLLPSAGKRIEMAAYELSN